MKKNIKAILIDFDGTLFDSLPALYQTYWEYLEEVGFEGNSEEFRSLNGLSLKEVVLYLTEKYHLKGTYEEQNKCYQDLLKKNYHVELKLFPGVREFLSYIKKTHLKLAVVSSGNREFIQKILDAEKLSAQFTEIVTLEKDEKSKPAPDLYLKALKILHLDPNQAIAIEDAPLGVQASLSAGIDTLQITHGESMIPLKGAKTVQNWDEITKELSHAY